MLANIADQLDSKADALMILQPRTTQQLWLHCVEYAEDCQLFTYEHPESQHASTSTRTSNACILRLWILQAFLPTRVIRILTPQLLQVHEQIVLMDLRLDFAVHIYEITLH